MFLAVRNLQIRVPTDFRSISEARDSLESALEIGDGMIRREWIGEELHLEGPGARARVTCEGGELIGTAELTPPASLFPAAVRDRFEAVLREAAGCQRERQ